MNARKLAQMWRVLFFGGRNIDRSITNGLSEKDDLFINDAVYFWILEFFKII